MILSPVDVYRVACRKQFDLVRAYPELFSLFFKPRNYFDMTAKRLKVNIDNIHFYPTTLLLFLENLLLLVPISNFCWSTLLDIRLKIHIRIHASGNILYFTRLRS